MVSPRTGWHCAVVLHRFGQGSERRGFRCRAPKGTQRREGPVRCLVFGGSDIALNLHIGMEGRFRADGMKTEQNEISGDALKRKQEWKPESKPTRGWPGVQQ